VDYASSSIPATRIDYDESFVQLPHLGALGRIRC
jgi:hypothetical protein